MSICLYFQVHQPYRLRRYSFLDISKNSYYFDEEKNKALIKKIAEKCYLPTNAILLELIKNYPEFKVSFSFSGVVLEQFEQYYPEVLTSFKQLVDSGQVEILAETYFHSLAFLYSKEEFFEQISLHKEKIYKTFGVSPKIFRNTELIYNNDLASEISKLKYEGIIIEGADKILGWKSPNFLYKPINSNIKLLLKNYKLADDIAFRFSDKKWKEFPLTAEKYAHWINSIHGDGNTVNLFMDYETFGEHQWASTGIFEFLKYLPQEILKHPDTCFHLPSEVLKLYDVVGELDIPNYLSWADIERDLSAWLGNDMQHFAAKKLYSLGRDIKKLQNEQLLKDWRKLQISDHFYYMCTKWFNDGDVHKYFNPYSSPYEGFIYFMNVIKDISNRIELAQQTFYSKSKTYTLEQLC